ncbi:MAG: LacI family DNA-binding transcriptional regulator [Phycisphaerales bacterium]|nr:MAG: LacI family DNA-binding transcriptional regulator [Phycisphaerales bacterium]
MTVSRVIHGRYGVSERMRQKVLKAMKRRDYVPDLIAAGLRSKSTNVIGLVIPDICDHFFPEITRSIQIEASREDCSLILTHSNDSYALECHEINMLRGFKVKGLIIAPSGNQKDTGVYKLLRKHSIPFVFIDRIKNGVPCSSVATDSRKGAFLLGRYLAAKKYRKWGYLKGPAGVYSSDQHAKGLRDSLAEKGGESCSMVSVRAGFREKDGYAAVQKLRDKVNPDVIIGVNDLVAIGAYRFLREIGVRVPHDVALAGFSDLHSVDLLASPLTTVREPVEQIGRIAMELLLAQIREPGKKTQSILLEPHLVVRDSA